MKMGIFPACCALQLRVTHCLCWVCVQVCQVGPPPVPKIHLPKGWDHLSFPRAWCSCPLYPNAVLIKTDFWWQAHATIEQNTPVVVEMPTWAPHLTLGQFPHPCRGCCISVCFLWLGICFWIDALICCIPRSAIKGATHGTATRYHSCNHSIRNVFLKRITTEIGDSGKSGEILDSWSFAEMPLLSQFFLYTHSNHTETRN